MRSAVASLGPINTLCASPCAVLCIQGLQPHHICLGVQRPQHLPVLSIRVRRQVTARMDRFPDATAQDLARCDGICIICREEMSQQGLNKKLHCGHVFHLHCLRCVCWHALVALG